MLSIWPVSCIRQLAFSGWRANGWRTPRMMFFFWLFKNPPVELTGEIRNNVSGVANTYWRNGDPLHPFKTSFLWLKSADRSWLPAINTDLHDNASYALMKRHWRRNFVYFPLMPTLVWRKFRKVVKDSKGMALSMIDHCHRPSVISEALCLCIQAGVKFDGNH